MRVEKGWEGLPNYLHNSIWFNPFGKNQFILGSFRDTSIYSFHALESGQATQCNKFLEFLDESSSKCSFRKEITSWFATPKIRGLEKPHLLKWNKSIRKESTQPVIAPSPATKSTLHPPGKKTSVALVQKQKSIINMCFLKAQSSGVNMSAWE